MKQTITALLLMIILTALGQREQMAGNNEIYIEKAIAELNIASASPGGELFKEASKGGITGHYIFDITIREKGYVATVFVVNSGENSITMQNNLKNLMKDYRFSFKMPKGKSYKFQYTFNF